jgi:hypothetical protein
MSENENVAAVQGGGKTYGVFLPVFIVFLAFFITSAFQLVGNIQQQKKLAEAEKQVAQAVQQTQVKTRVFEGLARDLVVLAQDNNAAAQQIVNDLRIEIRNNPIVPGAEPAKP